MSDWDVTAPLGTPNTNPNRFDIISSTLRGSPRNRSVEGEPIYVKNGNQRVESGFYRQVKNGRITYVDQEGRPVDDRRLEAARAFDQAQREGKIFDLESQSAVSMDTTGGDRQPRTAQPQGMTDEQVRARQQGIRDRQTPWGEDDTVESPGGGMVRMTRDGRAYIETPEGITSTAGVRPARISAETARDLSEEDARQIFRTTFGTDVPAGMSATQALAERLRNTRRQ